MSSYKDIIQKLPAPQTKEEQYIYALVCSIAEVDNKYKKLSNSPFYRLEQYWRAFYTVMNERLGAFLDTAPKANEVGTSAIKDNSISTAKLSTTVESKLLGDKRITENMLVDAVANKLLGNGKVTESMLAKGVIDRLLTDKKITEEMLAEAVVDRLLANNKITTAMIIDKAVTYSKLSTELQSKIDRI